jgi:ABC-type microcin C transport system permease subunit YejE
MLDRLPIPRLWIGIVAAVLLLIVALIAIGPRIRDAMGPQTSEQVPQRGM